MEKELHNDVVVIGLGAMGSAALYSLARRGYDVCGIEQFDIGHSKGSSHGETRLIRKAYFEHPDYVSLLHKAYEGWHELQQASGEQLLVNNGLLLAGKSDSATIKGLEACYAQHNLPHEVLSPAETRERWPQFKLPDNFKLYYDPIAGFLHAEKSITAFCRLARTKGASLFTNEKVTEWNVENSGSVIVTTDQRTITADKLIISCGAWASGILNLPHLQLEVQRKVLHWYQADDLSLFQPDTFPNFFIETNEGGFYGFPSVGSGVKVGEHYHEEEISNPEHLNREIAKDEHIIMSEFVSHTLKGLNPHPEKSEVCMYTMSDDHHFILDLHPDYENVVIAAGFSGHGFKFAPVIGQALADLAFEGETDLPIDFLRLARFGSSG